MDIDSYAVASGDLIGEDRLAYNLVTLLGGGTPVNDTVYNLNNYLKRSGRIIGEDGRVYNLVNLIQELMQRIGSGGGGGTGLSAGFGTPTATANTLPAGSSAAVTVSASGPDTAKIFSFQFEIPEGADGQDGNNGWTPTIAVVADGDRLVLQLTDWTGGDGDKPITGGYITSSGLTANIADATDIRGVAGKDGNDGDSAYQIAVDNGFTGTIVDWLDSLKGDDGADGQDGEDAINIDMSVEAWCIPADTTNAMASTQAVVIKALKGNTAQTVTVGTISGLVTGLTASISNDGTTAVTVTLNAATTLSTKSGAVTIPIAVDGKTFSKTVAWALSLTGATGAAGAKGDKGDGLPLPDSDDKAYVIYNSKWVAVEELPLDITKIPTKITAKTREGALSNQPISIQVNGGIAQTTLLDIDGILHTYLRPQKEYTVKLLRKSHEDMIFSVTKTIATGELDLPLTIDLFAPLGNTYANPVIWDDIVSVCKDNAGVTATKTVNTFGDLSGSYKWQGGVLALNGNVYGIPYNSTTILEIDPETKTATTFGSLSGTGKWSGGVLAPNGKIHGIPFNSTAVLEIDPETRTTATFGSLSGTGKWQGGVLATNGKIYGLPSASTTILEIDPETRTATTFGELADSGSCQGGVLALNGKVYGISNGSAAILEIDPETKAVNTFGSLSGTTGWSGIELALNGKLYGIPKDSTAVLEIDPETRTTATFGSLSGTEKWQCGAAAHNGRIYGIPRSSTTILEIDPETRTASKFGSLSGTNKWIGGVLALNGKIYGIPYGSTVSGSTTILEIDIGSNLTPFSTTSTLSAFLNKY